MKNRLYPVKCLKRKIKGGDFLSIFEFEFELVNIKVNNFKTIHSGLRNINRFLKEEYGLKFRNLVIQSLKE